MEEKVSIVIPNFNGVSILKKTLPSVLNYSKGAEVLLVDDASNDDSVRFVHKKFKKVKVVRLKKNVGFARAVNKGVEMATGEYIILLNSDVSPQKGFLKNAIKHFSKNKKLFAVGFQDYSHEKNKIIPRGKGIASFNKGFFLHSGAFLERGNTLWVSGGSGMFRKEMFKKLGGFDPLYRPFYWEDIDLSFRAWRTGYTCYFEPMSKVDHYHEEGAILSQKSTSIIRRVSYRNQFLFFWKNVNDIKLNLLHLIWLPYHLLNAFSKGDIDFFIGFAQALGKIPTLVLDSQSANNYLYREEEVLLKIEKQ